MGIPTITLWMLLLAFVGIPFSPPSIAAVLLLLAILAFVQTRFTNQRPSPPLSPQPSALSAHSSQYSVLSTQYSARPWELLPFAGVAAVLAAGGYLGLSRPETTWDVIGTYGLMAKAFFLHHTIWLWDYDAHNYYPINIPLLTTWLYIALGRVDDALAKLSALGCGIVLAALFHGVLRREGLPRWAAGVFTLLLLLATNQLFQQLLSAQTDLPLTLFVTGAAVNLWWWLRDPALNAARARLAGLFCAATAWTKLEGTPVVGLLLLAAFLTLVLDGRWRKPRVWLWPLAQVVLLTAIPSIAWSIFRTTHGIEVPAEHVGPAGYFVPAMLLPTLAEFGRYLVSGRSAGLWVLLLVGGALFARPSLAPRYRFLALAFGLNVAAIPYGLHFSPDDPIGQVERAGGRLLMHVAPIGLLLFACVTRDAWPVQGDWRIALRRPTVAIAALLTVFAFAIAGLGGTTGALRVEAQAAAQADAPSPAGPSGVSSRTFPAFLDDARRLLPEEAAYLFQEPWGIGRAPRLRYELYPRRYERLGADASETEVRSFVRDHGIGWILIFDPAGTYPPGSWALQDPPPPWLERITLPNGSQALRVLSTGY